MKCLLISEKDQHVSAFRKMGVEAVLTTVDDAACDVEKAISSRKIGTLVLSERVREVSEKVLDVHAESGRLPYVMTLNG